VSEVVFEMRDGGVALITLNRPDSLNALAGGRFAELSRLLAGSTDE
jgi:enoyl-CoA hydratase/carnithine racemase